MQTEHLPTHDADPPWTVTTTSEGDRLVLSLAGEIDLETATDVDVESILPSIPLLEVCLDLANVTFIDSTGLGLVLRLKARARELGATADIVSWPQHVDVSRGRP